MSYDVSLMKNGEPVKVERHTEGVAIVLGGTRDAEMSVTYNYAQYFYKALCQENGLRALNGKRGADTIAALAGAVSQLGTVQDSDYWARTPGNAGYALNVLLQWAEQHPDGIWEVY